MPMSATNPENESEDMIPSSIFGLILLLSIAALRGRRSLTVILQLVAILAVVALFAHHATDSLGLSF